MQGVLSDWNDLRLVLAVSRGHGLTAAAKALGIDHSTVFRRLHALEHRLGVSLFERLPSGVYQPTEIGARLFAAAERMEEEALGAAREIAGQDLRLTGLLRLTSSETLAYRLLPRLIAGFRAAHPGVVVELAAENRVLSLSRREADVALRPTRPRETDLWGRKLAEVGWAVFGSRDYLSQAGAPASRAALAAHPMIGWDAGSTGLIAADWLSANLPPEAFVFRTASPLHQLVAARAGIGLAVLPCYLGDPEPALARALPAKLADLASELWIVTHADLKRTARVRAFFDVVAAGIDADRALIAGDRPLRAGQ